MSQGDDGGPKMPAPRPKPAVPAAVAPPVTASAKPPIEENPFLPPPESSSKIDAGWLALEEAAVVEDSAEALDDADVLLAPASAKAPAPPPPPPPPKIRPPPPPPPPIAKVELTETPTAPIIAKVEPKLEPIEPTEAPTDPEPAKPESVAEPESTTTPFKKRSRAKVLAFVLLPVVVLAGGGFAYQSHVAERARVLRMQAAAPTATQTTVEPITSAPEPAPPPTHTAEPPPSASASQKPATGAAAPAASIHPSQRGFLDTTPLPPGRRIVVDGRVVGRSPSRVAVRCGTHQIQIGDLPTESIDLPCGGEVTFTE